MWIFAVCVFQKTIPPVSKKITRKLAQESADHNSLMNYYSSISRDESGKFIVVKVVFLDSKRDVQLQRNLICAVCIYKLGLDFVLAHYHRKIVKLQTLPGFILIKLLCQVLGMESYVGVI